MKVVEIYKKKVNDLEENNLSVKAIFLDFYGTVVHEDGKIIANICNQIKENSKTEATTSEIGGFWWDNFSSLFKESYGDTFQTQRSLETLSLKNTLSNFDSDLSAGELSELMFNHWMKPPIFEDSLDFLKQNTIPVFILSNIDTFDIRAAIDFLKLRVNEVITSEDVKSYKPRSEMYEWALKVSRLSPDEVIHVGDSLSSDVAGANNVGIQSIWINRNNKRFTGNVQPDFTVSSLVDVLEISTLGK